MDRHLLLATYDIQLADALIFARPGIVDGEFEWN